MTKKEQENIKWWTICLCVTVIFTSAVFIGIPLILGGYKHRMDLNKNDLVETVCTVVEHDVILRGRSTSCIRSQNPQCQNFRLYYKVEYSVMEANLTTYNTTLFYSYYDGPEHVAASVLRVNKPLNSNFACFYSKQNPYTVRATIHDTLSYLIASLFFFSLSFLGILALSLYCLISLVRKYKPNLPHACELASSKAPV